MRYSNLHAGSFFEDESTTTWRKDRREGVCQTAHKSQHARAWQVNFLNTAVQNSFHYSFLKWQKWLSPLVLGMPTAVL